MAASKARMRKVKNTANRGKESTSTNNKNGSIDAKNLFPTWRVILMIIVCFSAVYFLMDVMPAKREDGDDTQKTKQKEEGSQKPVRSNITPDLDQNGFQSSVCPQLNMNAKALTDGRPIEIKELYQSKENYIRIYQIDNFLSKHECDGLCSAHLKFVKKSEEIGPIFCFSGTHSFRKYLQDANIHRNVSPKDFIAHTTCVNESLSQTLEARLKFSYSTAFYPGESKFSLIYEKRIEEVSGLLSSHGGKFQITSYPQNIGYKTHTDCTVNSDELRDRYATSLVYLQDVKEGGETIFTKLGIKVKPKQGRLIIWTNMDNKGKCDPSSLHEAAPVIKGRKYIIQRWYYYKNFQALGKRPMETEIPKRKPFQPRVSCDQYEEGSCRWYDEWGFDHLVKYNQIKHKLV